MRNCNYNAPAAGVEITFYSLDIVQLVRMQWIQEVSSKSFNSADVGVLGGRASCAYSCALPSFWLIGEATRSLLIEQQTVYGPSKRWVMDPDWQAWACY